MRSLVWFRGKELRVRDHTPLATAVRDGEAIPSSFSIPIFSPRSERVAWRTACSSCCSRWAPWKRTSLIWDRACSWGADLKFGTISPRAAWTAVRESAAAERAPRGMRVFSNQLVWREFAHATLWDRPDLLVAPFRPGFKGFPWRDDEGDWRAWVEGTTGYPVVDGDWANNDMGWQWSAGCGCDAQPYFRIFNPTLQGERFDAEGSYVRRWVPELAGMPAKYIHRPWETPARILERAGVVLGKTYPAPRVNHAAARDRFLRVAEEHLQRRV